MRKNAGQNEAGVGGNQALLGPSHQPVRGEQCRDSPGQTLLP